MTGASVARTALLRVNLCVSRVPVWRSDAEGEAREVAQQHQLRRTLRGALAATAVLAAMGTTMTVAPSIATADPGDPPAPTTTSQAVKEYKDLAGQAEKVNDDFLKAQDDLKARQGDLARAKQDMGRAAQAEKAARGQEERFREQVDRLSDASLQGAKFSRISVLMNGGSTKDFLDRAAALQVLSADNDNALNKLQSATDAAASATASATDAQHRAQQATDAANQLIADKKVKYRNLQKQIKVVSEALSKLSPSALAELNGGSSDSGVYLPGPGIGGQAMEYALKQIGVPYVWGGTTPSGFDCSGLTSWAFAHAGYTLPRSSRQQSTVGTPVSRDQLQPGDLVFFGSPVHHVGIYVGEGKMVNAPNFGEDVQVEPLQHDYSGARRIG